MQDLPIHLQARCQISELNPFPKNSRTHSDAQVEQIAQSIKQYGFTNPVLIDENNTIVAGHGRVLAASKIGMTELPCVILTGLSESQRRAYVIADNKLALNAGWDIDILLSEIQLLKDDGFDVDFTGFTLDELDHFKIEEKPKDFCNEESNTVFEIIIECDSEEEQESLLKKLKKQGLKCRNT